ncbi:alpha-L-arabinofuranosidase C-terminal domain-containing protein [Bifidobacterium aerophilum]|uniref:alpha-L-arabinofuranosidase C-terminal domain-containing protein n=1 Tax=Bifidobacterium aerophilum TaxID=1798155 RepID=UPI0013D3DEE8
MSISVADDAAGTPINPNRWGIFLEDISMSIDGGLNSDLVRNGAFEFSAADSPRWSWRTGWRFLHRGDSGFLDATVDVEDPVARQNPHYLSVRVTGGTTSAENEGYDGMPFDACKDYEFTAWVRARYVEAGEPAEDMPQSVRLSVQLTDGADAVLAQRVLDVPLGRGWVKVERTLTSGRTCDRGALRLVVNDDHAWPCASRHVIVDVDWVGLRSAEHAAKLPMFRKDLVDALRRLHPAFLRFPGGCIAHGYAGLDSIYQWKTTIGPVEHRRQMPTGRGTHQSMAIGMHEYLLLCEAIGAQPVPVLAAGVSCQFAFEGATPIPIDRMDQYIQDVLDFIEYANGDVDSVWGGRRAANGHPQPFNLRYLGLGNEDAISDVFEDRFSRIHHAVHDAYPDIQVIGTLGPFMEGDDHERGLRLARRLNLSIVDEHGYRSPQWLLSHLDHFDHVDRNGARIYFGEYSARSNALDGALAEAAFMASMERNGDAVAMASYAPLLAREGHEQWKPNLIYFNARTVHETPNYWVQSMFGEHRTDTALPTCVSGVSGMRRAFPVRIGLRATAERADFSVSDVVVTDRDCDDANEPQRIRLNDVTVRDGESERFPLALDASSYDIDMTFERTDGEGGLAVSFGDIEAGEYGEWFVDSWQNLYTGFRRVGGGIPDEPLPPVGGGIVDGKRYRLHIEVRGSDGTVRAFLDGRLLQEYRDDGVERHVVAQATADSATGRISVKVINVTEDTLDANIRFSSRGERFGAIAARALAGAEGPAPMQLRERPLEHVTVPPKSLVEVLIERA